MKANPKNNHLPLYNRSASGIYSFGNVYRLNNFFPVSSILNNAIGLVKMQPSRCQSTKKAWCYHASIQFFRALHPLH